MYEGLLIYVCACVCACVHACASVHTCAYVCFGVDTDRHIQCECKFVDTEGMKREVEEEHNLNSDGDRIRHIGRKKQS